MKDTSLNITLSTPLRDYIEERVAEEGYSDPGDYLRDLVRSDQRRRAIERLDLLLLEGLASGDSTEMTAGSIAELRSEIATIVERHRTT